MGKAILQHLERVHSTEQSPAGHPLHRALVDVSANILGLPARFQPERESEELQGHVGKHRCASGVHQAGDEDHDGTDGSDPRPGKVFQLLGSGVGVHESRRRRRLVTALLRH